MTTAVSQAHQRDNGLWVIPREEFAASRFDYKPGHHVVFGGPTTKGKTTLAFKLLEYCATEDLPAYVAVSKPKDPTTAREGTRLGFRRVDQWPTPKSVKEIFGEKPRGYLVWPRFGDIHADVARASKVTRDLITDRYTAGVKDKKGILVLDDTMVKSKVLGLDGEMTTILAMSGAMGLGLWSFVQKPTDSGRTAIWSYSQSEHVFMTFDPDENNQKRYSEIGGISPRVLAQYTRDLRPYEFLYFKRTENYLCIVGAK